MTNIILSTGSLFNFDLDTVMALAAETGFDGIELMIDWRRETYQPDHLQALMARRHLPILAVHSPFAQMFMPGWPADPIASVKQSVRLAEMVGAQTVVVHPPERWLRLQGLIATPYRTRKISVPLPVIGPGKLGNWLKQDLPDFQATTKIKMTVENMPCRWFGPLRLEPHHFSGLAELNQFQYLTLDTTHVGTRKVDLLAFYEQIKSRVSHIHLSNFNGKEHRLLHDGSLPLATLLKRLIHQKFEGLISLELGPTSLQAEDETCLRRNLQTSLLFCRQALSIEEPVDDSPLLSRSRNKSARG
jgi:sugar phosphate isomerase/epimerase